MGFELTGNCADFDLLNTRRAMWELVILKRDFDICLPDQWFSATGHEITVANALQVCTYFLRVVSNGEDSATTEELFQHQEYLYPSTCRPWSVHKIHSTTSWYIIIITLTAC